MSNINDETTRDRAIARARKLDITKREFLEHEFEDYALLREHQPVACVRQANPPGDTWLLTRYEDVSGCLRNTSDFSSQSGDYPVRPWIPQAIDPPAHTSYRRIMNKWFTPDAMTDMEPHIGEYAEELIDKMIEQDEFDFISSFADPFPTVIFCELMGFPMEDYEWLMEWKNILIHQDDGHSKGKASTAEMAKKLGLEVGEDGSLSDEVRGQVYLHISQGLYKYFAKLLDQRRKKPENDLITRLVQAKYDGERPLSQEELEDTIFLYYQGGLDTVASILGLIVHTLAQDHDKRRELIELMDDDQKFTLAIEELTRYHAMVPTPRRVTRDLELNGTALRNGDTVFCATPAANRDPQEFENPDALIYERTPNRHMAYGHGPHRCLGIHLARRELRIALKVLLRKLPNFALHPDHEVERYAGMKGVSKLWLIKA